MKLLFIWVINGLLGILMYEILGLSLGNSHEIVNMPFLNLKLKRKKNK